MHTCAGDDRINDIDWNTTVLEGRYPHMKQVTPSHHVFCSKLTSRKKNPQVTTRLEFIRFVFDFSVARLTKDRADIMWEALVLNAMSREEVETTLGWFYR